MQDYKELVQFIVHSLGPQALTRAALKLAHEDAVVTFLAHTRNAEEM